MIQFILKREKFANLVKSEELLKFLDQANDKSERLSIFYIKYSICVCISIPMMAFISVLLCWVFDDRLNVADFYHPMNLVLVVLGLKKKQLENE